MTFKCLRCDEESSNYMNGIKMCRKCCEETNTCQICGKEIISEVKHNISLTLDEIETIINWGGHCEYEYGLSKLDMELLNKLGEFISKYEIDSK